MEFEIVGAIKNNSVTILCSKTGSGKSTKVPQFLYNAGFTLSSNNGRKGEENDSHVIGITQSRRVTGLLMAKPVCYKMGYGDGKVIEKSNTVAYQTRYKSVGLGTNIAKIEKVKLP